ncbi:unnamed protein product [Closterium sp. Naga37s-1]|nr:unnamed protein product [Closterium sp. Naga37s-1]
MQVAGGCERQRAAVGGAQAGGTLAEVGGAPTVAGQQRAVRGLQAVGSTRAVAGGSAQRTGGSWQHTGGNGRCTGGSRWHLRGSRSAAGGVRAAAGGARATSLLTALFPLLLMPPSLPLLIPLNLVLPASFGTRASSPFPANTCLDAPLLLPLSGMHLW